ncbi:MAG: 50S ribosomal protein L22 [Bacilli bacterium]|nr:50S ribosomal protein L22 [Bacilli bacterium]
MKAPVTEATAIARDLRMTPRKARLLLDLVRNKPVSEAIAILNNTNKLGARDIIKVIKSASANASNNFNMNYDKLYIVKAYANDGIKMKRYMPRAKGSASGKVKRASIVTVTVKEK